MKNIFTIEPNAPFLATLAQEVWRQCKGDLFRLSRTVILLPTRRACRYLGEEFSRIAAGENKGAPVLLPRMRPLGESDEDEFVFTDDISIPPAIGSLKRLMLLTQQVQRRDPGLSWDQALPAAEALAEFLDTIQIEQCDISALPDLVSEQELAVHWQQTILFLDIVTKNWPYILAEQGCIDPAERRNIVLKTQAEIWRHNPPDFPVIAAGSTGSVPATAGLLDVIASMPQGAVILPGLDRHLDNDAWEKITDTHPQHAMKNLLEKMGARREQVKGFGIQPAPSSRMRLISESMRPAASTDEWQKLRGVLHTDAIAGLTQVTLDHPQEEAQVIALRLREFLEKPVGNAAFITGDRGLAVRVANLLRRWGVDVDDSGGAPLALSPLGTFLGLVLAAAKPQAGVVDLLALLKHPLAGCGLDSAACRAETRDAEIRVRKNETEHFSALKEIIQPLLQNTRRTLPLAEHIQAHIDVAEIIAATDSETGAARLWLGETGEDVAAWLDEWRETAHGFPPMRGRDYAGLFDALASSKTLRSSRATHPRVNILGPLEARLIDAELIILGGMNEGVWPPEAGFDPFMSRPMRKKFKLPSPEFRIGLSAHDFAQLCCAKQVMITRATRSNGNPSVPSRFLLQIETVMRAADLSFEQDKDFPWREWAHMLDRPVAMMPSAPPAPCPPLSARPNALSVTDISTWLRNPYALYAKYILGLRKLEELDAAMDASDRGTMIHTALEKFIRAYPDTLPDDAETQLLKIGEEIFAYNHNNPRIHAFWWARFVDIAAWFVGNERARRTAHILPIAAEPKGTTIVNGLTLKGRADRIDRLPDGTLEITDYKTGYTPSKAEVKSGMEPQLQLLALIAARGGFDGIAPAPSSVLDYWILKGGKSGCDIRAFSAEIPDLVAQAEAGLQRLIAKFADPASIYNATSKLRHDDYAHLSRIAEWGKMGQDSAADEP